MPNPVYAYISNIYVLQTYIGDKILKRGWALVCTQLKFNINYLFAHSLFLIGPYVGPYQVLPFWVRVDQGAMETKGYSTFPKYPRLKPRHQMLKCHIQDAKITYPVWKLFLQSGNVIYQSAQNDLIWFICLTFQLLLLYLTMKFDSFLNLL